MMLAKIRDYLELGRAPGAMATAMLPVVGAYTSSNTPTLLDVIALMIIGAFAHFSMGSLNEIMDRKVDANIKELSHKPLVSGRVDTTSAKYFSMVTCIVSVAAVLLLFNNKFSTLFIIIAGCFAALYNIWGKYIAIAYDVTLSLGCAFFVFFGASCIGTITIHTIFVSLIVFITVSSVQWYAGMKDVENDRKFSIPTTAVRWGYKYSKRLNTSDLNIRYIILLKLIMLGVLLLLYPLGIVTSTSYPVLVVLLAIPCQVFLTYKTLGKQNRERFLRLSMYDIATSWLIISITLVEKLEVYTAIVFLLPIIWTLFINYYLYDSALQPRL
ncbi:MAG: UbiA family prenyltransferase [Thermoplasmata archaeon]